MISINVSLNSIDKIKSFVNIVTIFDGEFDIIAADRYVIDAKSIMGLFSLDLSKPLHLIIHDDIEAEMLKELLNGHII